MKKVIIIILAALITGYIGANPVLPPPVISEVFVDSAEWFIELNRYNVNFNDLRIISNTDTAYFCVVNWPDEIVVLTQDSLSTPFQMNRNGGFLTVEGQSDSDSTKWFWEDEISWGNNFVNAPLGGQSLVMTEIRYGDVFSPESIFWLVKDNIPTPGSNPNQASTKGSISGFVYDLDGNPVSNAWLSYCSFNFFNSPYANLYELTTDNEGYFQCDHMFSMNYRISICQNEFPYPRISDTAFLVSVEPDSVSNCIFTVDTVLTGVKEKTANTEVALSVFPNPSKGNVTIAFKIPSNKAYEKVLVKIYAPNGEMIKIIPCEPNSSQQEYALELTKYVRNINSLQGIYYGTLELDGRKVASKKIIIE